MIVAFAVCACASGCGTAGRESNSASALAGAPARSDSSPAGADGSNHLDAAPGSDHIADAAASPVDGSWCCLQQEFRWHYSSFGWVHPKWLLTREGVLERSPLSSNAGTGTFATDVPDCGQDQVCLRDVHEALAHPDVVALFPDGKRFLDSIAFDGTAVFLDLEGTPISFGLPYLSDLPTGLKLLYELLQLLELQNLKAVVPSCESARIVPYVPPNDLDQRIWLMSAYLGAPLVFDTCEAALRCECASRPLVDIEFDESDCVPSRLAIAEVCTGGV